MTVTVQVDDYALYVKKGVQVRLDQFEGLQAEFVVTSNESLVVVNKWCCLGNMISAGGVDKSIVGRISCDFILVLINDHEKEKVLFTPTRNAAFLIICESPS